MLPELPPHHAQCRQCQGGYTHRQGGDREGFGQGVICQGCGFRVQSGHSSTFTLGIRLLQCVKDVGHGLPQRGWRGQTGFINAREPVDLHEGGTTHHTIGLQALCELKVLHTSLQRSVVHDALAL